MSQDLVNNESIYRNRIIFLVMASLAPLVAAAPFIIGLVGASFTPGCNESNCTWGVLPWLTFFTAPAGFALFVFALIRFLASLRTKLTKTEPATPTEQNLRRYYFALMATASVPLLLAMVLLLSFFAGPTLTCDGFENGCTETMSGFFFRTMLISSPELIGATWLCLLAVAIWNRVSK